MKRVNYKYINILLLLGIIYLLFLMHRPLLSIFIKLIKILSPIMISFALAYILYPIVRFLNKKKIPKLLSISIVIFFVLLIIFLTCYFALPVFFNQLVNLFSNLTKFFTNLATNYNIDTKVINEYISTYLNNIVNYVGEIIGNGTIFNLINKSISYVTNTIIIFILTIYLLCDMDKIRSRLKDLLISYDRKKYNLIKTIDRELCSYLKGLLIFMVIQFFEYALLFFIIGHPNFLLIGVLACVTTIIPYFGGVFTNVLALLIASVISKRLFILTLVITLIFPNIDGYIISPKIYGKTNQIPAVVTIISVIIFGSLFGFMGIIIAVPTAIILSVIYKAYRSEIKSKIKKIREK